MRLRDKVVIVTGGGSGIGEAVCLLSASKGATVAVGDVVSGNATATTAQIIEAGGKAMHGSLDVSDESSVEAFVSTVLHKYSRVDVLVNNAGGIITPTSVLNCKEFDWDRTFALNVKGVFLMSRAVLPSMVEKKSGSIINVSSAAALAGRKNLAAYSAAKGAIIALTRAMAHDHGQDGIRVNCICPGPTLTPAFFEYLAAAPDPEALRRAREQEQPLGRLGEPLDIAQAILFLASDEASWVSGTVMAVDGGNTAI
jgi:NAD(P)-dependent dehydrogenase (short-subunit alcohol dehydrogenase family)